jgi:hypothetical protein
MSPLCVENHPQWAHFISAAKALGDRLGPILIQLPPSFPVDLSRLRALRALLSSESGVRAAFEFRHNSWFCDEVYDVMRQNNWALVKHAVPSAGVSEQWDVVTSDWVYARLHGKKDEHVWDYSAEELQPYADKIAELRAQGLSCFVYFLNDADARAPANATAFFRMVRRAAGERCEGLLGVEVDGAGVLKGMFGKQQQQQQQQQKQQQEVTRLKRTGSSPSPSAERPLPPHPPIPSSPSSAAARAAAVVPSKAASGIMRFFAPQPAPAASSPAKKLRKCDDGPARAAAADHDRGGNATSASSRVPHEDEVIVLD